MKNVIDVVDFHSHILPGADHGSSSVETSLEQLKLASGAGVTRIVATPHFYAHRHTLDGFLSRRNDSYERLVSSGGLNLSIKLGAEVLLFDSLDKLQGIEKLAIGDSDYILIELPFADFREEYCDTVKKIQKMGLKVILAHVDRYPKDDIERMIDVGVSRLQINAEALSGLIKPKHIFKWADSGLVVALGSDIHNADAKAYKRFNKAKDVLSHRINKIKQASDEIFLKL